MHSSDPKHSRKARKRRRKVVNFIQSYYLNTFLDKCNSQTIFKFSKIPDENVLLALKALNISKSTGLDGIPAKLLKIASEIIAPSLTCIFNLSLTTGTFVDEWKVARVSPLFKSDDRR